MRRPIVILSVCVFAITLFVLLFPSLFYTAVTGVLLISCLLAVLFVIYKKKLLILPAVILLMFSAINPYMSYIKTEKTAQQLVREVSQNKETVFTATVEECNVYETYSQIFAYLTEIDGVKPGQQYKIRIGGFNREKLDKGTTITFQGLPQDLSQIKVKDFNTPLYLRSRNIFIDFPYATIVSSSKPLRKSLTVSAKDYTRDVIYRFVPDDYSFDTADLCFSIFAGDKDTLSGDVKKIFRKSGLTHILCVSGLHLAILAGLFYKILSGITLPKNIKCILVIGICIFYTLFTGASISTIRACFMCSIGFAGLIIGRKTDALRSLFASLLIITLVFPYSVFDPSCLLSFSATLGIICFSQLCPKYHGGNTLLNILNVLASMLSVNLGAVVFSLPVSALFFSEMSVLSVISTLSASIVAELLLIMIPMMLMTSTLSGFSIFAVITEFVASICNFLGIFLLKIAEFFADFRYAAVTPVFSDVWIFLFSAVIIVMAIAITWDLKKTNRICVIFVAALSVTFSFLSLCHAIIDDNTYKVTYYRKNENDRQLSIKLSSEGYLLVNADNVLCLNDNHLPFDTSNGENYLLVIPDESIQPYILSDNISDFSKKYGLQKIYVPNSDKGTDLANTLADHGITCFYLPENAKTGDIGVNLTCKDGYMISVDDGTIKTQVLFADSYSKNSFDKDSDICAYFTRRTKNQFNKNPDTIPDCKVFITRLAKDEQLTGCINTNGERTITVKG